MYGLDKNIGKRGDHRLNTGGQSHGNDLAQDAHIDLHIFPAQAVNVVGLGQKQQHEPGGNELGDNGSIGHTGNTGVENQNKYQIQHNIEDAGQDQEVQRPCGIPTARSRPLPIL